MKKDKELEENQIPETEAEETAEETEATVEEAPEQSELEALQSELNAAKEQYMRLAAEYDNFRKRTAKEKESTYNDAKAATYIQLVPVIDNFERAFAAEATELEDFKKGVEMVRDQLMTAFQQGGVEAFGAVGDEFDPNIHNAVMHGEDDSLGENVISDVFQKGYKMGDRILRHAMVKVVN